MYIKSTKFKVVSSSPVHFSEYKGWEKIKKISENKGVGKK